MKHSSIPAAGWGSTLSSEACVLLCSTMTLSRVVEKLHKWHRKSLELAVEVLALAAGVRCTANEDEVYDFGVDKVGVVCAAFKDKF